MTIYTHLYQIKTIYSSILVVCYFHHPKIMLKRLTSSHCFGPSKVGIMELLLSFRPKYKKKKNKFLFSLGTNIPTYIMSVCYC